MPIGSQHSVPNDERTASTRAASITRCDDDVVALDLTTDIVTSGLDETEKRLMRLVDIGFGTIEVTVNALSAGHPDVTVMLARIAGRLAPAGGQLTIRTSTAGRIGEM